MERPRIEALPNASSRSYFEFFLFFDSVRRRMMYLLESLFRVRVLYPFAGTPLRERG